MFFSWHDRISTAICTINTIYGEAVALIAIGRVREKRGRRWEDGRRRKEGCVRRRESRRRREEGNEEKGGRKEEGGGREEGRVRGRVGSCGF